VERSHGEFLDWREFFEAGSHVQDLLSEAVKFHKEVVVPLFRVRALVLRPRSPFAFLSPLLSCVLSESFFVSFVF
jgi:hypothetical protein